RCKPACPARGAAPLSGAPQMRDRLKLWRSRVSSASLHAALRTAPPSHRNIPQQRHVLVTGGGLDDVDAGLKREMIAGHQHAVGGRAIEEFLARCDRL